MQFDAATIERMVRDVLNQIQPPVSHSSPSPAPQKLLSVAAPKVEVPTAVTAAADLNDRVITADLLKAKVRPGSRITVGPKSIITPAAQDFLRLNRITWERGSASSASEKTESISWRVLLSRVDESVKKAVDVICSQNLGISRAWTGTGKEAAAAVVAAMSRGEVPGIVVVTSIPHEVACRVNRHRSVRAAVVLDLKSWDVVQSTLNPNVVCIDPSERSFMELQNILKRVTSGTVTSPANWDD